MILKHSSNTADQDDDKYCDILSQLNIEEIWLTNSMIRKLKYFGHIKCSSGLGKNNERTNMEVDRGHERLQTGQCMSQGN